MSISVGEIGRQFNNATGYDMSGSTGLELKFTKPSGVTVTVTQASSPAVTAPATPLVDSEIGNQDASTYFQYTNTDGDFYDEAGTWTVCGTYIDGTPKSFEQKTPITFTVFEGC